MQWFDCVDCRLIFEDDKHAVHLYNAVNDHLLHLEELSLGLATALWDAADPNIFLLSDGQMLYTYLYSPLSLQGAGKHSVNIHQVECTLRQHCVPLMHTISYIISHVSSHVLCRIPQDGQGVHHHICRSSAL